MKSPLSTHALPLEAIREGEKYTYLEFDADGNLSDSIVAAGLHRVTVDKITDGHLVVTTRIGWVDEMPFIKYGLIPDETGAWSTQYCMVKPKVAMKLMRKWTDEHADAVPAHDRGGKARQISGYNPR